MSDAEAVDGGMHDMTDAVKTPDGRKSDDIFGVAAKELGAS